jgi:hypothetical protein
MPTNKLVFSAPPEELTSPELASETADWLLVNEGERLWEIELQFRRVMPSLEARKQSEIWALALKLYFEGEEK